MRVKTKIYFFIGAILAVIIIGYFFGVDFIGIGASVIGLIGAAIAGKEIRKRDDRRGNSRGIDDNFNRTREADRREGDLIDREGELIDDEKADTRRERELLEELQKRHPQE